VGGYASDKIRRTRAAAHSQLRFASDVWVMSAPMQYPSADRRVIHTLGSPAARLSNRLG